jgi:hypothetical protein
MLAELRISSSPFFKCPRVHPCECGGIHEDPAPFSYPAWWIRGFISSTDGALVDAWLWIFQD